MRKSNLEVGLHVSKERRHMPGHAQSRRRMQQAIDQFLRVQLFAVGRVHGRQNESVAHNLFFLLDTHLESTTSLQNGPR
jgi:hypothetical protein